MHMYMQIVYVHVHACTSSQYMYMHVCCFVVDTYHNFINNHYLKKSRCQLFNCDYANFQCLNC